MAGVFDKEPKALALAEGECGVPGKALFRDLSAMLRAAAPECVAVATTTDSHHFFTMQAIEAGAKYILCEKPMASSLAQCDAMIEVCRENGVRLAINHHFRFSELHRAVKKALQSDLLGGVTSATVVAGNVGMAMIGTHLFELFSFISGEMPFEVSAWLCPAGEPNPRGPQFQDPGRRHSTYYRQWKAFLSGGGHRSGSWRDRDLRRQKRAAHLGSARWFGANPGVARNRIVTYRRLATVLPR